MDKFSGTSATSIIENFLSFDPTGLDFASVEYFAEEGQISGELHSRIVKMINYCKDLKDRDNDNSILLVYAIDKHPGEGGGVFTAQFTTIETLLVFMNKKVRDHDQKFKVDSCVRIKNHLKITGEQYVVKFKIEE